MRVIGQKKLRDFYGRHAAAKQPCLCWVAEMRGRQWQDIEEILTKYSGSDLVKEEIVQFSLSKDKFKLETEVSIQNNFVIIKRVGTHKDFI